jgi:hypothetical protein
MMVSWPLSGAGFSLTTTTSLWPPTVWEPFASDVQTTGMTIQTVLPLSSDQGRFFRLEQTDSRF